MVCILRGRGTKGESQNPHKVGVRCARFDHHSDKAFQFRRIRTDRLHKSMAIDFCSSFACGHPQRLTWSGCGFGSGSIVSFASETAAKLKSARAFGCLLRAFPSRSPIFQISRSESSSLHSAEIFRTEEPGRNAPGLGFAGACFL